MAKKTILIVDDEEDILDTLEIRLKKNEYDVIKAGSGEEALTVVRQRKPDIIVLDVMMPPPNGYQVCRILKDSVEFGSIPIVLLTARGSESDKFWGMESGADAYMSKPFNNEELLALIRRLVYV